MRPINPPTIRAPFAAYSHGVLTPPGARLLAISGQLGVGPDDVAPPDAQAQAARAFANIDAVLAEAGLDRAAVIRLNAYVTARAHMAGYMAARDAWVGELRPASTLMIVAGFTRPEFLVEIEALAAG
jgi:enamine deaminase RidA (YjgF/YER057c/UK114 family)